MSKYSHIDKILMLGGTICFNFINTIHDRFNEPIDDYLIDYLALLKWSSRLNILSKTEINRLKKYCKKNPNEAKRMLKKIKYYREIMYKFFSAVANKRKIDDFILSKINSLIPKSICNFKYYKKQRELLLLWDKDEIHLEKPFWSIAKSAFDILNEVKFDRIKECKECGWIFLDETKNNNRKWCNMLTCGARNKARRYYKRQKMLQSS